MDGSTLLLALVYAEQGGAYRPVKAPARTSLFGPFRLPVILESILYYIIVYYIEGHY